MLCCETQHGDPQCREPLEKIGKWYVCPRRHGRLVPAHIAEIKKPVERKSSEWKSQLPKAFRRGTVTKSAAKRSIFSIHNHPYETDWEVVVHSPDATLKDGEILAAVEIGSQDYEPVYTVRRFRRVDWLTEKQKRRLKFSED